MCKSTVVINFPDDEVWFSATVGDLLPVIFELCCYGLPKHILRLTVFQDLYSVYSTGEEEDTLVGSP